MMRAIAFLACAFVLASCGDGAGGGLDAATSEANVDAEIGGSETLDSVGPDAPEVADIPDSQPDADADPIEDGHNDQVDASPTETTDTADDLDTSANTDDGSAEVDTAEPSQWRSLLYPEDWSPGFADPSGAILQDYSFAGYHHGEAALGAGLGPGGSAALERFDVMDFGAQPIANPAVTMDPADPTATDSTAAFQAAIDAAAAAGGGLVYVPPGLFRIDGLLTVRTSRTVIAGDSPETSRLWFTREAVSYGAHLRFGGAETVTGESALTRDAATFDSTVEVADGSGFAVGDDVLVGQVISDAFIAEHGMTGTWQAFNGTWQAFYRRTVVAVDSAATAPRVTLDVPLRAPLKVAYGASVRRITGVLSEVGVESLGVANAVAWEVAWASDQDNVISFEHVADGWLRDVASFVSPGAPASGMGSGAHLQSNGILVSGSKRVTVADSHIAKAQNRGSGGNGYLFEVRQSSEILTRDCSAREGRHNFIQNWGFGTTGCVWLRVFAADGAQVPLGPLFDTTITAPSEYHHSLATANLVDASTFDDGFDALNRGSYSTGAGHSATECVFWNFAGLEVVSLQFGRGYVIGSAPGTRVSTSLEYSGAEGSAPEDWVEGRGVGPWIEPGSLYDDQLLRRLAGQ